MFCEKCGNPLKENEKFCPKCGTPVKIPENPVKNEISGNDGQTKPEAGNAVETAQKTISETAAKAKNVLGNLGGEGSPLKKFADSKYKIPAIIGGAVLLLLIVLIANGARINNLVHKTFSSPESYYQFVEKKAMEDVYDLSGDLYDSFILESLNSTFNKSVSADMSVELGKDGEELLDLAGLAGVDLSWLKSVQGEAEFSIKNNIFSMGIGTSMNKDDIVSCNMIMDFENGDAYIQIPELTKTYMGIYMEDVMSSYDYRQFEQIQEQQELSKDLVKALPSQSQVEKLLKKYTKIALKCVDDVSMGSKTLKVEGIQQKCTELKVTIDADTMQTIMEAVLEEMIDDKDIEKYIVNVAEASGQDGDEIYENFQDNLDYALDNLDRTITGDGKIVMKVYVDGKGNIKGRTIEWNDRGDKQSISILSPQKGSKAGFEFSVNADGEKIELSGSGKRSGDKITGEYELKYNGAAILDITTKKLNIADLKKGQLNGEIGIKVSSKIGNLFNMGYSRYGSYLSMITDLELKINASSSRNSTKCKIQIIYDEQDIATISASVKTGSGSKASVPSSKNVVMVEGPEDALDWLEEVNWDKVISRLEKTDLPSEVIDLLEDIVDAIEDEDYYELYRMF